jgi:hypothetical protein
MERFENGDERLVRYWFCSPDCCTEFAEVVEDGERDETLYDETPNTDQLEEND